MENYNFFELLHTIRSEIFLGDVSFLYSMSRALACIFAAFALLHFYNSTVNTPYSEFNMKSVLRILMVIFCVCNFYSFVLLPFDGLMHLVSKGLVAYVSQDSSSLDSKVIEAYRSVEDVLAENTLAGEQEAEIDATSSVETAGDSGIAFDTNPIAEAQAAVDADNVNAGNFWERAADRMKSIASGVLGFRIRNDGNLLSWFISILIKIVRYVMVGVSGVYCIVLGLLGPFVFAFSLLPSFEGGVGQWFARYIQISFWVPMTAFVDFINFKLRDGVLMAFDRSDLMGQLVFPTYHLIVLDLITLCMLFAIPSVCSWLIQSSGASEVNSSMMEGASRAAQMAILKK